MAVYEADIFAEWLTRAFENSRFKSFSALADEAGLSRSSVSSLANAKKQSLTNKPSQPKRETVIDLATALNTDVNEALNIAGYATKSLVPDDFIKEGFEGLDEDDIKKIVDFIRFTKSQKQHEP